MSKLRGLAAAKRVGQRMKERRGQGGPAWGFILSEDEEANVRFRGLLRPPIQQDLKGLSVEDLTELQVDLQGRYAENMTQEDLKQAILQRYEQVEPVVLARHYLARNTGKRPMGLLPMNNCGDSEAALEGNIREQTSCRFCAARLSGDEGVGWPGATFDYTLYDYRVQHRITHADGSKEYVLCTAEEQDYCKHCEWNEDHDSKDKKHRRLFENGVRIAEWGSNVAQLVEACERRIRKYCRSCCKGKLKAVGAYCPHPDCGEELPWKKILSAGWNPDDPDMATIECPECSEDIEPEQTYKCSKCDDPKPARLCDVDINVRKSGSGRGSAWSFTEQLPVRPLDPEEEKDAKVLGLAFPDYDVHTASLDVATQLKQLGYADDPLGEISGEPDEAPRVKPKGGKKKKGSPFGGKKKRKAS